MPAKTIYQQPQIVKVALFFPVMVLIFIGGVLGMVAAPLISGFSQGRKLSHQFLMLNDLEK